MDKNSLLYWYPKIKDLGIPTPRTEIVKLTGEEKKMYFSSNVDNVVSKRLVEVVARTILNNFKLPVFIRTDQISAKHSWRNTCYLDNLNNLSEHLYRIIDASRCVDFLGPLPIEAIVVRKYIPMYTNFHAFSGRMPVNKERRYFISGSKVLCHHPYWVEDSIREPVLPKNETLIWQQLLELLNQEIQEEVEFLTNYADLVGKEFMDYWSVDFCLSEEHKWYLIDMAEGKKSWHPKPCVFMEKAIEEGREL